MTPSSITPKARDACGKPAEHSSRQVSYRHPVALKSSVVELAARSSQLDTDE